MFEVLIIDKYTNDKQVFSSAKEFYDKFGGARGARILENLDKSLMAIETPNHGS